MINLMLLHSLLKDSDFLENIPYNSIKNDCEEIIKILVAIIKTSKN